MLATIKAHISTNEHIEVILVGLSKEYDSFISYVLCHVDPYIVEEIEVLLLSQEEHFKRFKIVEIMHVNITFGPSSSTNNPRNKFYDSFNKNNITHYTN